MTQRALHVERDTGSHGDVERGPRRDASWADVRIVPRDGLATTVRTITGWRELEPVRVGRWERPQAGMSIILSFGPELSVAPTIDGPATTVTSFVVGLHDRSSWTEHDGCGHGVQLDLTTAGAYALLGDSLPELHNGVHAADAASTLPVARLVDRLVDARDPDARLRILHEEVAAAVAGGPQLSREVLWADVCIRATHGTVRIGALADELGWSRRRLVERFSRETGATPKALARLVRFRRAFDCLVATPSTSLAALAAECGFADQPHFTHEFRGYAGCTPGRLVSDQLPRKFVQDTG